MQLKLNAETAQTNLSATNQDYDDKMRIRKIAVGQHYRQLTREDRIAIFFWLAEKVSKAEIASRLGFHRSTLTREIKRKSNKYSYTPAIAHRNAENRCHKKVAILSQHPELKGLILEKLKARWSPEQIAGRLKRENSGLSIASHETIYKFVYSKEGIEQKIYRFLFRHKPKRYPHIARKTQSHLLNRTFIQERPEGINKRKIFGHCYGKYVKSLTVEVYLRNGDKNCEQQE